MKTFDTDNRWSAGSLQNKVPDDAIAAYGARWIDHGYRRPDIVPDRQGVAYDDLEYRDRLIRELQLADPANSDALLLAHHDEITHVIDGETFQVHVRRAGGYFYVVAWITD